MKRNIKFVFRSAAQGDAPKTPGLTVVIRTDARHATASLKKNIVQAIVDKANAARRPLPQDDATSLDAQVEKTLHMAYQDWGHNVLSTLADCLDYQRYGLTKPEDQVVNVHFYNARLLSNAVYDRAAELIKKAFPNGGGVAELVSLDDLIEANGDNFSEIAFSRLFNLHGDQQGEYMARPGAKTLDEQLSDLRERLIKLETAHNGEKPAIVFLEDNVRHAKMLNWVIGKMEDAGIFDHGKLAGIATCFCCASADERKAIKCRGETVPVAPVVDYGDAKVDVVTPRDLLFDGFVVQIMDKTARLPAVFMDVEKLFKIRPEKKEEFRELVTEANIAFCERLEQEFGIRIPLGWFSVADAISEVAGVDPKTPMIDVLKKPANQNVPPPDTGLNFG
jgi:hypothetical protein